MRNNKILFLIVFPAFIVLAHEKLNGQENRIKYNINGNLSTYYSLSHDSLTHMTINGPGNLTVSSRARFKDKSPDSLSFGVLYQIDNVKINLFNAKKVVRMGTNSFIQSSNDKPSTSRTFSLKIAPEVHDVAFSMLRTSPQVDILVKFIPDSIPDWMDIKPDKDTVKIKLKADKSNPQNYYQLSASKPQKFKVTGPTTLRVLTRLEYNYTMQGIISYRVRVARNDTIIGTFKLSGNPSSEAQYVNKKKFIPGTLGKFFLKAPSGSNNYEFSLLDKRFNSLIRVSKQKNSK
jgi:hypothetical protein